jgi:hypothetical protein
MAGEEEWARRIVEKELKRSVVINDDGSRPSMYDLRIGPADAPELAIECVGAIDPTRTETWNVGPVRGPLKRALRGDWFVTLTPNARIKAMEQRIGPLLRELEDRGVSDVPVERMLRGRGTPILEELESLGVTYASCFRLPGEGTVHRTMEGTGGGVVDFQGTAVPAWVGQFLRDPDREDVLHKLRLSGAAERHAFIFGVLGGTPWEVDYYLNFEELDQLPTDAPNLPQPVTEVWIVGELGQKGLRWNGSAWRRFEARGEGIENPP